MRLFVLARHAQTTLNLERRVSGDPVAAVELTPDGVHQAEALGQQLAGVPIDVCVHTRFARTRHTAEIALAGRDLPLREEVLLDDIAIGELEGETITAYRAWKQEHARSHPFPGGESLDDAARRYAEAFRRLVAGPEESVLVITHEIVIRYAANGAAGSDDLDWPVHEIANARPFLFGDAALVRAAERIDVLAGAA